MLNSLSGFVFGRTEQNRTGDNGNDAGAQACREVDLNTNEGDLGWLLVDVAGNSNADEVQAQEKKDPSLRCPDGTIFDGILDGLSSCSESPSLSEVEEVEENNNALLQPSSLCLSSSDTSDGEQNMKNIVVYHPHPNLSCFDDSGENIVPLDAFFHPSSESDEENDNHVDLPSLASSCFSKSDEENDSHEDYPSLASSCSSLSVIFESDEEDLLNYFQSPKLNRGGMDKLTDSWMVTPPPCFTGTQVNIEQLQSSPLENKLIEYTSMYACLMMNEVLPPHLAGRKSPNLRMCDSYEAVCRLLPNSEPRYKRRNQPVTAYQDVRKNVLRRQFVALHTSSQSSAAAADRVNAAQARLQQMHQAASHPLTTARECVSAALQMKQAHWQQQHQTAAAKKFFTRSCTERSNKAKIVESSSRKCMSARNRCLKPSGRKCGRFCQRTQ